MKAALERLINRLKEPSTYAGLGGAAMLLGIQAPQFNEWTSAAAGVALFVSIFIKEAGSSK